MELTIHYHTSTFRCTTAVIGYSTPTPMLVLTPTFPETILSARLKEKEPNSTETDLISQKMNIIQNLFGNKSVGAPMKVIFDVSIQQICSLIAHYKM